MLHAIISLNSSTGEKIFTPKTSVYSIKFITTFLGLQVVGYLHPVAVLRDYANYYLDQNVVDCGTFGRSTHFESITNF